MEAAQLRPVSSTVRPLPLLSIPSRNVQSSFQAKDQPSIPPCSLDGQEVVVIELGSSQVKIGMARDAFPQAYPAILAHLDKEAEVRLSLNWQEPEPSMLTQWLTARNKQSGKKKLPPNHYQSIISFNRASEAQPISRHNDAFPLEWTRTTQRVVVGAEALLLERGYRLRRPMQGGSLNEQDYSSWHELAGDLSLLWQHGLGLLKRKAGNLCAVLVIPEGCKRWEQRVLVESALIGQNAFKAVMLVMAGQAASYGTGSASCLVLGVGGQCSWVQAVEEGVCARPAWRQAIGGDHLSALLGWILRQHQFPHPLNPADPLDARLLDELKERLCTLEEEELQSGLFECTVRRPGETTRLYPFKMYEERFLCPHALFESGVPFIRLVEQPAGGLQRGEFEVAPEEAHGGTTAKDKPAQNNEDSQSDASSLDLLAEDGIRADEENNNVSLIMALDEAIIHFLTPLAEDKERLGKLLSAIILQGGSVAFPGFSRLLLARLRQQAWERWSIDPSLVDYGPRDLDPRWICWKGGAIACRLESSAECWILPREWRDEGPSVIARKVNYPY